MNDKFLTFKSKIDTIKKDFDNKIKEIKFKKNLIKADVVLIDTDSPDDSSFDLDDVYDLVNSELSYLNYRFQDLYDSISRIWQELSRHETDGHLPAVSGPAQMQQVLDILKLSGDYDVVKKPIFASDGSKSGLSLEILKK